jgi:hypothetical protein
VISISEKENWFSILKKPGKVFFFTCIACFSILNPVSSQDSLKNVSQDSTGYSDEDYDYEDNILENPMDDTLTVKPGTIDESKLDELSRDKDFDYSQAPTVGESLWDRFWTWVRQFITDLLRGTVNTNWGRVLLWVACIVIIVVIAFALLKVDAFRVLFKGADAPSVKGVFHENIHEMDFEALIKEATEKGDLRNAVRLIFLYSLKLLSDNQHIKWQPGKTNHDYLSEIKTQELKPGLSELSFYFDYAWYGGFPISTSQLNKVNSIFNDWRNSIS